MEYDGVNGVVLLNNEQGTDGSSIGGSTSSFWAYTVTNSGINEGITNQGWPDGFLDPSVSAWELYHNKGETEFSNMINGYLSEMSWEAFLDFIGKCEGCRANP